MNFQGKVGPPPLNQPNESPSLSSSDSKRTLTSNNSSSYDASDSDESESFPVSNSPYNRKVNNQDFVPDNSISIKTKDQRSEEEEELEESVAGGTEEESQTESWTTDEEEEDIQQVTTKVKEVTAIEGRDKSKFELLIERALFRLDQNRRLEFRRGGGRCPIIQIFRRQLEFLILRMFVFLAKYHRELCILFLLFASGLASLRSGPAKTRSTPSPRPFFEDVESGKFLDDYYRGDYVNLVQTKIPQSPSFVFYYAPWDSESVAAREVFLNVAQYFHKTVPGQLKFYAVNCWWPHGECRKNYKNLSHFPIFVAHLEKNAGIIYSGPIRGELMIKFVNSLLMPITRIDTEEEMWRFRAKHDAIMLGYFNFTDSDSIQAYETYLQMSLRNFEADPFGQVGFGVFLKYELAQKFFLTSSNVISLVLFNEIHTAKWTGDRHTQGIRGPVGQVANWIIERTKKSPITWAYQVRSGFANRPVALGPVDLVDELRKGPLILLITRRYFPSSYSPFYAQLKEVALDYFNCNKSGNVTKLRRTQHQLTSEWLSLWNSVAKVCSSKEGGPVAETCEILREQLAHWRSRKGAFRRESLANYEKMAEELNFTGFSCASEREFKFLAVDPIDVPYFPQLVLGGLGYENNSDPVLFLIDAKNEIVLPMMSFNISALAELIHRYTIEIQNGDNEEEDSLINSSRRFWVQSTSASSAVTSTLRSADEASPIGTEPLKLLGSPTTITQKNGEENRLERGNVIRSMTSDDLFAYLVGRGEDEGHSLFLMFTAKFCGMCGVSLTHFLQLSRFMKDNYNTEEEDVRVTFAKLDMFKNSLPPELSPDHLPTFVYFPANNRSNSRVFGGEEVANTKNLLRFLLSEMDGEDRVKLSLSSPGCRDPNNKNMEGCGKNNWTSVSCNSTKTKRRTNSSNISNSSSPEDAIDFDGRESCVKVNKFKVAEMITEILRDIQVRSEKSIEEEGSFSDRLDKVLATTGIIGDLELLRSMKITLDIS